MKLCGLLRSPVMTDILTNEEKDCLSYFSNESQLTCSSSMVRGSDILGVCQNRYMCKSLYHHPCEHAKANQVKLKSVLFKVVGEKKFLISLAFILNLETRYLKSLQYITWSPEMLSIQLFSRRKKEQQPFKKIGYPCNRKSDTEKGGFELFGKENENKNQVEEVVIIVLRCT